MLEVTFERPDVFKVIAETLTRIGYANEKTLAQVCYILFRRGRYYLCHHFDLLILDGEPVTISDDDLAVRNSIARLLVKWRLISVTDSLDGPDPSRPLTVIKHSEKANWTLVQPYKIGRKT